jgi:uncharacterized protein
MADNDPSQPVKNTNAAIKLTLSWKALAIVLAVCLATAVYFWKPWQNSSGSRKITVSGSYTVKAEPDLFTFSPYFQESGDDVVAVQSSVDKKVTEVVNKLKELGVDEKNIQASSNNYAEPSYLEKDTSVPSGEKQSVTTNLTIILTDKDLSQKVQDYLKSSGAEGATTPYTSFSTNKQKELESQARNEAVSDAKAKAEQTAKELGAKVGKVIEIKDTGNLAYPLAYGKGGDLAATESTVPILGGQQEFTFTVEAIFAIR